MDYTWSYQSNNPSTLTWPAWHTMGWTHLWTWIVPRLSHILISIIRYDSWLCKADCNKTDWGSCKRKAMVFLLGNRHESKLFQKTPYQDDLNFFWSNVWQRTQVQMMSNWIISDSKYRCYTVDDNWPTEIPQL